MLKSLLKQQNGPPIDRQPVLYMGRENKNYSSFFWDSSRT